MESKYLLINRYSEIMFTDEKIKEDDLELILQAGLNAPSGRNSQEGKIVVVQDKQLRDELSEMNAEIWSRPKKDPFHGAPTILLVLVPKSNSTKVQDGSAILTMLQCQAFILGIGSRWINRLKEMMETDYGQELLSKWGLEGYEGIGICVLGYPKLKGRKKQIKENRVIKA